MIKMASDRNDGLISLLLASAALLLPYVEFEPAPSDFLLLIAAAVFFLERETIPRFALLVFITYVTFYIMSGIVGVLHDRQYNLKLERYYIVEIFLVATSVLLYSIFFSKPHPIIRFFRCYIAGSIISCMATLALYYGVPSFERIYRDATRIRIQGFFKDPNVLGPFSRDHGNDQQSPPLPEFNNFLVHHICAIRHKNYRIAKDVRTA